MSIGGFLSDLFGGPNPKTVNRAYKQLAGTYPQATAAAEAPLQEGLKGTIGAYQTATPQEIGALTSGQGSAVSALTGGQDQAVNALTGGAAGALAPWADLFGEYGPGAALYEGTLGAGPQGSAEAAHAAFMASPFGQQMTSNLNTMGEAVARGAGTTGQAGQSYIDAANQALGITSQAEQGWLSSLAPFLSGRETAAGGISNVFGQFAPDISNVYTGTGANLANTYGQFAPRMADVYGNQAQAIAAGYGLYDPLMSQINWQGILGPAQARVGGATQQAGMQAQQAGLGMSFIDALIGAGGKVGAAAATPAPMVPPVIP